MAEFDILVTGGTLPDGTVADIGIRSGTIAAIGTLDGSTALSLEMSTGRANRSFSTG